MFRSRLRYFPEVRDVYDDVPGAGQGYDSCVFEQRRTRREGEAALHCTVIR